MGYFPFFTENRPQKHKKHAILHTSQANGGARAPPPWLRYCPYQDEGGVVSQLDARGGVEDTRLEAKAKDTKKFRGQGQTLSRPRRRIKDTDASVLQKKSPQKFFFRRSQKKVFKIFFRRKRSSKIFFRRST